MVVPSYLNRPHRSGVSLHEAEKEIDAKSEYPWDIRELFAHHDLFGLPFDEEYGGTGTGTLMLNVAIEEVAKACASSALMLLANDKGYMRQYANKWLAKGLGWLFFIIVTAAAIAAIPLYLLTSGGQG